MDISPLIQLIFTNAGEFASIVAAFAGIFALKKSADNSKIFNKRISDVEKQISGLKDDNTAILRSKIKERAQRCVDKGFATPQELEELDGLYDRYKKNGGNSFVKELMADVDKLPYKK